MNIPENDRNAQDRSSVETVVPRNVAGPTVQAATHSAQLSTGKPQQEVSPMSTESNIETPRSEYPPQDQTSGVPAPSYGQHNLIDIPTKDNVKPRSTSDHGDYFNPLSMTEHTIQTGGLSVPVTPGVSREGYLASPNVNTIAQDSPGQPPATWKHASHNNIPSSSEPATARPTSVPNFLSSSFSRNREGQDIPRYPESTFANFGSYHRVPPQTRFGRTRSSHSPSRSVSSEAPVDTLERNHSGSKTVGGTPAQSPSIYAPSPRSPILSSRKRPADSDDGRPNSQILHHVAHLQAPIETHKLNKDIDPMTGRKVLNNYELIDKLGSGQHGTVKRGRNLENGELVAVKIVRRFSKKIRLGKSGGPNDMIKKEVAILKKARHPHVVSLFEVIDDPEFDKVYLVLEYVERGEIVWRKLTDKAIATFEMERLEHERANGYNETLEKQAIDRFNAGVDTRRLERAQILDEQKRLARERLALGNRPSRFPGMDPLWSLEYGEYDEQDPAAPIRHEYQRQDFRMSRADIHAVETAGESPNSATPVYAPQAVSITQALNTDFSTSSSLPTSAPSSVPPSNPSSRPVSRPVSRPPSPSLEGTMYGPYVENKTKSELELQQILQDIIDDQREEWSIEEENHRYVPCLTLAQALDAFRDTVLGLEYLHYQGIIHRDIKPANLLWTADYRVKISDFGVSYLGKPIREDVNHEEIAEADTENHDEALELAKTVGTPAFYAPELCGADIFDTENNSPRPAITGQIDVWALGVTLYGMVFGRLPFFHHNEFRMYDKIAREEVFIPRLRLKGVSHTDRSPGNHHKRMDDVLEYEDVDDTLRDLLKRLLAKRPNERISLKEVKHHPWVVSGIENKDNWLDETDPSRQSEGKKIEVSTQEVQDAVVGLTFIDQMKKGVQRLSSVLRGGRSRKRTNSNPKPPESVTSSSVIKSREDRRTSLKGDENIFAAALKQSREGSEHPLAQSVAASPEFKPVKSYFANEELGARPQSAVDPTSTARAPSVEDTMATADSMKTITARDAPPSRPSVLSSRQPSQEDFTNTTTTVDPNNISTSSLGGIFGGARRLANTFRSHERGLNSHVSSHSSRESSVDVSGNLPEDYHASPSLGISSAYAAGHVNLPDSLREETEEYSLPTESSADSLQRAQSSNIRRSPAEFARSMGGHKRSISYAADVVASPTSLDEQTFKRPVSATESSFAISSSSDQIVSSESTAHSRIPSEVSGASSLSGTIEEDPKQQQQLPLHPLEKSISPLTIGRRSAERPRSEPIEPHLLRTQQDLEAGYAGEGELDSDSDDEGLAMA